MRRGEIWWASLPVPKGSEPGYRRPVLIVQADAFNESRIRTVVIAAMTSTAKMSLAPGNVPLSRRASGLPKTSVVNVSQLLSVDRTKLTHRVKSLAPKDMAAVDEGLRQVLGLP